MKSINCYQCGAQNPAQSKYCNNCGASLESDTTHLCPACETPNPIDLLYCENCGTRLVEDALIDDSDDESAQAEGSRSEPFTLPSRPPGQTGDLEVSGEIPEWLKTGEFTTGAEAQEEPEGLQNARDSDSREDEDELTLDDVSGDHAPQDDLPTWLLDDETREEIFRGDRSTDELFMASVADDEESAPQETGSLLEGDIPEWLQGLADTGEESLPRMPGAAPSDPEDEDMSSEDMVDQPQDVEREQEQPAKPMPDATAELQAWLTDLESEDLHESPDSAPDESPHDESAKRPAPDAESAMEVPEEEFLGWLSDAQDDLKKTAGPQDVEDDPQEMADQDQTPVFESGVPAWLSEAVEDADELEQREGVEESADNEVPDWLVDAGQHEADVTQLSPAQEDEVPAWLQEMDTAVDDFPVEETGQESEDQFLADLTPASTGEEPDEAGPDAQAADEDEMPEEDFLAWLEALDESSEQAVEKSDVGDVVAEDRQEPAPDDTPEPPDEPSETMPAGDAPDAADPDSELPSWLAGVTSELDDAALVRDAPDARAPDSPKQAREQFQTAEDDEESGRAETAWGPELPVEMPPGIAMPESESGAGAGVVNAEDLPDWFSDVMADIEMAEQERAGAMPQEFEGPPELENVPQQLAGGEFPEWLDSPFEDEMDAEPTPIEEIPEWLRSPLQAKLAQGSKESGRPLDDIRKSGDWDDLLDALPPPDEAAKELSDASVPEWLRALKPEALGGEAMDTVLAPNETSGPLAGLSNVIGVAPAITQLRPAERIGRSAPGTGREQQTELLRQLTRSAGQRSVQVDRPASVASPSSRVVRLLLAILLLGLVIGGLSYPTLLEGIGAGQGAFTPAAEDALSIAAGQPAIVAFEYTPSMAGALDPQADALLRTFLTNDSTVIGVSQSPAGVAMARQSLQRAGADQGNVLGYIPGGPVGLRRLRYCLQTDADCQTLYGQAVDAELRDTLSSAALIVVLAGDGNELLDWIEQVGTPTDIPLLAAVTPAVAPMAAPYHSSGQLAGVVSNIVQTEDVLQESTLPGMSAALTLTQWLAAAAILLGGVYYLLVGAFRRDGSSRYE